MATTAFLSMWISNSATCAMMLPIIEVVLIEVIKENRDNHSPRLCNGAEKIELQTINNDENPNTKSGERNLLVF